MSYNEEDGDDEDDEDDDDVMMMIRGGPSSTQSVTIPYVAVRVYSLHVSRTKGYDMRMLAVAVNTFISYHTIHTSIHIH